MDSTRDFHDSYTDSIDFHFFFFVVSFSVFWVAMQLPMRVTDKQPQIQRRLNGNQHHSKREKGNDTLMSNALPFLSTYLFF